MALKLKIASICLIGQIAAFYGCKSNSANQTTQTGASQKKSDDAQTADAKNGAAADPAGATSQTHPVTPVTQTQTTGAAEPQPAQVSQQAQQTIAQKYPNYKAPTSFDLADPKQIKVYNYLKEAITSVNGQAVILPEGGVYTMPKYFEDTVEDDSENGTYVLTVTTASGKTGSGRFDVMSVDSMAWRASISLVNGTLEVKQNAGGGGGANNAPTNFTSKNGDSEDDEE